MPNAIRVPVFQQKEHSARNHVVGCRSVSAASIDRFSGFRLQRISPFFSIKSWKDGFNSFVFINIVERRKSEKSSPFIFNNLKQFFPIFYPLFFHPTLTAGNSITTLISIG